MAPGLFDELLERLRREHERQLAAIRGQAGLDEDSSVGEADGGGTSSGQPRTAWGSRHSGDATPSVTKTKPEKRLSWDQVLPAVSPSNSFSHPRMKSPPPSPSPNRRISYMKAYVPPPPPPDPQENQLIVPSAPSTPPQPMIPTRTRVTSVTSQNAAARAAASFRRANSAQASLPGGVAEDNDSAHSNDDEVGPLGQKPILKKSGTMTSLPSRTSQISRRVSFGPGCSPTPDEDEEPDKETEVETRCNYRLRDWWVDDDAEEKEKHRHFSMVASNNKLSYTVSSIRFDIGEATSEVDWFVGDPHFTGHFCWDLVSLMLILYDSLLVPLSAFGMEFGTVLKIIFAVTTVFWTLDVVRNFFVGYRYKGNLVLKFTSVVRQYLRTRFVFDLVLSLVDWAVIIMDVGAASKTPVYLRLVRLLRLLKVRSMMRSFAERIQSEHLAIIFKIAQQLGCIVLMCHMLACVWFALGESASSDSDSWVRRYEMDDASFGYRYTTCFHWALTQFTPASIEVQPRNFHERAFAIVTLLFALIMFSLFISGITSALMDLRTLSSAKSKQFWLLRRFLSQASVPQEVSLRVQYYCSYAWDARTSSTQENDVQVLELLSAPLRAELRTAIFQPRMSGHPLFVLMSKVAPLTMQLMCTEAVSRICLARGDVLFHVGQTADRMFFITHGTAQYKLPPSQDSSGNDSDSCGTTGSDHYKTVVKTDSWVGEAALWIEWGYVGTLHAMTECDLVAVDADKFRSAVSSNMRSRNEAALYARGFIQGLNRLPRAKVSDLYQSGLIEGLWFRLLNEYQVARKHHPSGIISNSIILPPSVAALVSRVFSSSDIDDSEDNEAAEGSPSLDE